VYPPQGWEQFQGGQYGADQYGQPGTGPYGADQFGQQAYAVPVQQGWGQPGGYPQGPYQPGSPTGAKSRKGLWFAIVGIVVVAGLVVGGIVLFGGGGDDSASPGSRVTTYLEALAKGDSAGALATGTAPPSRILLTDSILKQQQQVAKISGVTIVNTETEDNQARVEATYNFGDQHADEYYTLTKRDGKWLLDATTVSLTISSLDDVPQPEIYGVDVSKESKLYVFPGPLKFGSADSDFAVTQSSYSSDDDKFSLSPSDSNYLSLQASLSAAGKQKAQLAVQTAMKKCSDTKDTSPDDCPNYASSLDLADDGYLVDGTATWTAPTDYSQLEYSVGYDTPTDIRVSGKLVFQIKAKAEQYKGSKIVTVPVSGSVTANIYGTVDISQNPAVYTD